jgi:hypothetical protein
MANKIRVLFAVPSKGGLPDYWMDFNTRLVLESCIGMFAPFEIDMRTENANHLLNISRNVIAEAAMNEGYDKVVMCDKDHPLTTENLRRILSHDRDIVGALYPGKKPGKVKWFSILTPGAKAEESGLIECDFMGTGLMCIDVRVLRKIAKDNPDREFQYDKEDGTAGTSFEFFPVGIVGPRSPRAKLKRIRKLIEQGGNLQSEQILSVIAGTDAEHPAGRMLGEDYGFCALARMSGCRLYCDTKLEIKHEGAICFPVLPEDVMIPSPLYTNNLDLSAC